MQNHIFLIERSKIRHIFQCLQARLTSFSIKISILTGASVFFCRSVVDTFVVFYKFTFDFLFIARSL